MEESILKADIFFFVTTIAVVIMTVLWGIVLGYLIVMLRDLQKLARKASNEASKIIDDVSDLREGVRDGIEGGIKMSRAAARAFRPAGLKSAIAFLMNTIQEMAGSGSSRTGRHKKRSSKRGNYEGNE